jgi:hypothetical protein
MSPGVFDSLSQQKNAAGVRRSEIITLCNLCPRGVVYQNPTLRWLNIRLLGWPSYFQESGFYRIQLIWHREIPLRVLVGAWIPPGGVVPIPQPEKVEF